VLSVHQPGTAADFVFSVLGGFATVRADLRIFPSISDAGASISMTQKWMAWLLAGGMWFGATSVSADPPWARLLATHRPDADPEKIYKLTENDGPWLIMAASFAGDGAEKQAQDLVLELRKKYKMQAYIHDMNFDYKEAEGRGVDRYGGRLKFRYQKDGGEQFAVLVGSFADATDEAGQKTLSKIKSLKPEAIAIKDGETTNMQLANWREICRVAAGKKTRGPMGAAFLTTNPLLPDEYFNPQGGLDPEVAEWNEPVEYSLLKCPGKFTLQVATFRGNSEIRQDKVKAIQKGEASLKSSLEKATMNAHEMTLALRAKGYEAYEFHDRYASIVTVGSFNSAGTPRADGKTEINPQMYALMKRFGSNNQLEHGDPRAKNGGNATSVLLPKTIIGKPFDMSPIPIHVPRVSISQAYSRRK
jgi:hypothetical protein